MGTTAGKDIFQSETRMVWVRQCLKMVNPLLSLPSRWLKRKRTTLNLKKNSTPSCSARKDSTNTYIRKSSNIIYRPQASGSNHENVIGRNSTQTTEDDLTSSKIRVIYKPGKMIPVADALSRKYINESDEIDWENVRRPSTHSDQQSSNNRCQAKRNERSY